MTDTGIPQSPIDDQITSKSEPTKTDVVDLVCSYECLCAHTKICHPEIRLLIRPNRREGTACAVGGKKNFCNYRFDMD